LLHRVRVARLHRNHHAHPALHHVERHAPVDSGYDQEPADATSLSTVNFPFDPYIYAIYLYDMSMKEGCEMITIRRDQELVTLINAFTCEPETQNDLVKVWQDVTEVELGGLPGIISAALHRSLDGTRVVNYAQWRSAEDWENLTRVGKMKGYFERMGRYGKPDALLYKVVHVLDKTVNRD
jgi:heme-degrading monooxygenase HmoA